jgi:hypothetical protein
MRTVWLDWLTVACQAALFVTFATAAASKTLKAGAFAGFRSSLPRLLAVPRRMAPAVALAVVLVEATIALSVVVPALAVAAFGLAALTMAVFAASIVVMIRRGAAEPCHCFGVSSRPPGRLDVARNLVLLVIAVTGFVAAATSPGTTDLPLAAVALCAVAGGVLALLLINMAEIAELLKPPSAARS